MPCGDSSDFDIFFVGCLQVHDARADRGERRLRDDERVAEVVVEPDRDVARELDVLALVVADRDLVGVVEEDVGGHQHRVVEQADAHGLLAVGLLLELRHAPQLAERGDAVEHPGELGVGPHVALHEQQAAVGVEAGGHAATSPCGGSASVSSAGSYGTVMRVQVDDAEDRVVVLGGGRARRAAGRRPSAGPRPR